MSKQLSTSKFENNFIEKTYNSVVNDASIAFSELVANAWDAGASHINITTPPKIGGDIIIEDDGSGMTDEEFNDRWMVIAYNRVEHQGEYVEYLSPLKKKCRRLAYGRNGAGRHSLFCFNNKYTIETVKNGKYNFYQIKIDGGESAFSVTKHRIIKRNGNGTKLVVKAVKKCPTESEIIKTLEYRFMFDPEFKIIVNGKEIDYNKTLQPTKQQNIKTQFGELQINIYTIPDGEKSTAMNGITFWSGKRLIGNPSWTIDDYKVEDARRKFALKHLIVVNTDYLINDVEYDWSDFKRTEPVLEAYDKVIEYIRNYRKEYYSGKTNEVRKSVIDKQIESIEELSIPAQYELNEFFDCYLEQKPDVDSDELDTIISALVQVLKSRSGLSLLSKLGSMDTDKIDELNTILDKWSIADIKTVLDEIDSRIQVIDAIQKLSADPSTDELHVLHPLISQARWLFGIEYDSNAFTFNKTLSTVIKDLMMGIKKESPSINWRKKPDLVFCDTFSIAATCTEDIDKNGIALINNVLIIELKRGGFNITRQEMSQAEEYVDVIFKGNKLNSKPRIRAFVIGDSIDGNMSNYKKLEEYGEVTAYTYDQLVSTAEKRLFNLKSKLTERYNDINTDDYITQMINQPKQLHL